MFVLSLSFLLLVVQCYISLTKAVPVWNQCGGINYTGSTECDTGLVCNYVNDYYWQCQQDSNTDSSLVQEWGQCAGIGYEGSTTCAEGLECVYSNDWYSQCLKPASTSSSTLAVTQTVTATATTTTKSSTTESTTATTINDGVVTEWGQCGGIGYEGSTTCAEGLECVYSNDWYSQCLKPTSTSSTDSSTSTTATTATTTTTTSSTTESTTTITTNDEVVAEWGQCGGIGYTGSTNCIAGTVCTFVNEWYSQCQVASGTTTESSTESTTSSDSTTATSSTNSPTSSTSSLRDDCLFAYGRAFEDSVSDYSEFDYISIWIGTIDYAQSTDFNIWYQGKMLDLARGQNKMAVFYSYIIAFEARNQWGLQDCDVGTPNLCQKGAAYIRENRDYILDRYSYQAMNIASYGVTKTVFLIEPDFWQYYGDHSQEGGPNSGEYMRLLFDDICARIREHLPNAIISWDISAWIGQEGMRTWWGFFESSPYIDFIHTSGGQSRPDLDNLKPNELEWSFVSLLTGKKIIADCGYGVGGGSSGNCGGWNILSNLENRIDDGVVGVTQGTFSFNPPDANSRSSVC